MKRHRLKGNILVGHLGKTNSAAAGNADGCALRCWFEVAAIGVGWQANYRYGLGENWEFCGEIDLFRREENIEF